MDERRMIKIRQPGARTVARPWLPLERVSLWAFDRDGFIGLHIFGDAGPDTPRDGCVAVSLDREEAERLFTLFAVHLGHFDLVKDRRTP